MSIVTDLSIRKESLHYLSLIQIKIIVTFAKGSDCLAKQDVQKNGQLSEWPIEAYSKLFAIRKKFV